MTHVKRLLIESTAFFIFQCGMALGYVNPVHIIVGTGRTLFLRVDDSVPNVKPVDFLGFQVLQSDV